MRIVLILAAAALAGCTQQAEVPIEDEQAAYVPPIGSNEIFREMTSAAPGHELIVADLRLAADTIGAAHYHPWEEYLYVIEGSAVLAIEEADERILQAGEAFIIPARAVHIPTAGPDGVRAIIARVHDEGDPVRVPVGE